MNNIMLVSLKKKEMSEVIKILKRNHTKIGVYSPLYAMVYRLVQQVQRRNVERLKR